MYYTNVELGRIEDVSMKEYCKNRVTCRRDMLLKDFDSSSSDPCTVDSLCTCCDVCEVKCASCM